MQTEKNEKKLSAELHVKFKNPCDDTSGVGIVV